ncbi:MAG: alpha-L-rhamnosidase N-terminal domain-containing protein, partial [Verrucomicrobia bacterium]|nr:alpha-L-rhamnosidase N-terminal domain-containing protein [Verrucomicrobiota bacterium]
MKQFVGCLIALPFLALSLPATTTPTVKGGLAPSALRCEYRVSPLGIGETAPRLSWIVEASGKAESARGQRQTAYRVFVASSEAALAEKTGDLWDSGKVASDETTGVVYAGKPLVSGQRCFWKVKVWDRHGVPSEWSAPAMWTMGLLNGGDWKAEWIGYDKARVNMDLPDAPLEGAKWIWHAADKPLNAPPSHRLFVTTLALPADIKIAKAELLAVSDDNYKFVINSNLVASGTAWQRAKATDVTQRLLPGNNSLRAEVWNATEGPAGLLAKIVITTADGKKITHVTDASWKTAATPGANWHKRDLDIAAWPAARVLGDYGMQPWGKAKLLSVTLPPVPFLRTGFRADKPVTRATLYATGLGIFDVHLNGKRVSDDWFNPGWTEYTKRVYYRAYDVTKLVHAGDNALGAVLADGWFSGYVGYGNNRDHYGKLPRVRAQLNIEFADGSTAAVGTGPNWKAAVGPLREADFLMGETYDARLAMDGWDASGAAGGRVRRVEGEEDHRAEEGRLCAQHGPELCRRRAAEGEGCARSEDRVAFRRAAQSRRHDLHDQPPQRALHRHLHLPRWRHGGLDAAVHVSRLPIRRDHRPEAEARLRHGRGPRAQQRHAGHGQV